MRAAGLPCVQWVPVGGPAAQLWGTDWSTGRNGREPNAPLPLFAALAPTPLHSVLEAVEELETYKAALLYGSADLGLTGSILVRAGWGQAGMWGLLPWPKGRLGCGLQALLCCCCCCCADCRLWCAAHHSLVLAARLSFQRHPRSERSRLPA